MKPVNEKQIHFFREEGYLVIRDLLTPAEVDYYKRLYDDFLSNTIDASAYRSDLSGDDTSQKEKITQIMVPSRVFPELLSGPIHQKTHQIARLLLGDDMELDFDMLINKAPYTNAPTPWHQDAAYWIDMPDKRALSCWVAIDPAFKENGCMWYVPKSHMGVVRPHKQIGNKGALCCEASEEEAQCIPLEPGSCVLHHGYTLHYSRGNNTGQHRRALITNFRPKDMIALERKQGYDHTGERNAQNKSL